MLPNHFKTGYKVRIIRTGKEGYITRKFPYDNITKTRGAPRWWYRVWWENQDEYEVDVFVGSELERVD